YQRKGRGGCCRPAAAVSNLMRTLLLIAAWISLLAYCMKSGMVTGARLISPYYPFLLLSLLVVKGQAVVVRRRCWNVLVWLTLLIAFPVLMVTPGRPLWPAQTILTRLHDE